MIMASELDRCEVAFSLSLDKSSTSPSLPLSALPNPIIVSVSVGVFLTPGHVVCSSPVLIIVLSAPLHCISADLFGRVRSHGLALFPSSGNLLVWDFGRCE
ncbi:uncharacterized [Tachysurus ichikawai]